MRRRRMSTEGAFSTTNRGILAGCALFACIGEIGAQEAVVATASTPIGSGAALAGRLQQLLDDPALTRAHVGLIVQVAETGEILFATEAERRFTPASNTKIVTAAVALEELGAGYRWPTRLVAAGPIRDGRLEGSLWVIGSGAPDLKRSQVAAWASALREAGIGEIAGDVIGDDRAFDAPQWGIGWMWDDLHAGWAAGVSGLQLHPSSAYAYLFPGAAVGEPAALRFRASDLPIEMENRVRTGAPDSEVQLRFMPPLEGGAPELRGWIPSNADSVTLFLAPRHPTLYFLRYFGRVLADSGIVVEGRLRRVHEGEARIDSTWGYEILSDSLGAVLADLLKPSDNQIAESVLRTLGYEEGMSGSDLQGLEVIRTTLSDWGIEPGAIDLTDGSGMSRYNEVTPSAVNRLLRAMWRHPDYRVWLGAMPIAATDGTLRQRMIGTPAATNVRAKTGSLSSVRALSGYVTDGDGETLIFSLLLNGYDAPGEVAVAIEDLLVEQISLYHRPVEVGWPEFRERQGQ